MPTRITADGRRARLGLRHRLAGPDRHQRTVADVAGDLVGLHATDASSVFLSARARIPTVEVKAIEAALYDERSVVRMLGMRRTMFVVPTGLMATVQASCTDAIAARERKRTVQMIEEGGLATDGHRWLAQVGPRLLRALDERGEATAAELAALVPEMKAQLRFGEGKKWAGQISIGSRLLFQLSAEGAIVRGRPRGSWLSTQYRWAPASAWLGPDGAAGEPLAAATARVELVRGWLATYGPGTVADIKWWTGWTVGEVKKALAGLELTEVEVEVGPGGEPGGEVVAPGFVLVGDEPGPKATDPWVAFLPALDPAVMGWKDRGWYLGEHGQVLFDRSGNPGPTVWCGGRIVGGWAQRTDGDVVFRLLADIGREAEAAVEAEAARVLAWLGDGRVVPRFRTPLERELTS